MFIIDCDTHFLWCVLDTFWTPTHLDPSEDAPPGSLPLFWILDTGIIPLRSQYHPFSFVPFPPNILILFKISTDPFWPNHILDWLICLWYSYTPWHYHIPCDTYDTFLGTKTSLIVCGISFHTLPGYKIGILISLWWLWGRILHVALLVSTGTDKYRFYLLPH